MSPHTGDEKLAAFAARVRAAVKVLSPFPSLQRSRAAGFERRRRAKETRENSAKARKKA